MSVGSFGRLRRRVLSGFKQVLSWDIVCNPWICPLYCCKTAVSVHVELYLVDLCFHESFECFLE